MLQNQYNSMLKDDVHEVMASLKESNRILERELQAAKGQLAAVTGNRDQLIQKLTEEYEEKLVGTKTIAKNLSEESMNIINDLKLKDQVLGNMKNEIEHKHQEIKKL